MKKFLPLIAIVALLILAGYEYSFIRVQQQTIAALPQPTTTAATSAPLPDEKPLPVETIESFPGDGFKKTLPNGITISLHITDPINHPYDAEWSFDNYDESGDAYTFRGAEYKTLTFADANSDWFRFSFVALGPDELYFEDDSGHEGIPNHYLVKGIRLINLSEMLHGLLADEFPHESWQQFGITFYPSYMRVEEENYCCDILYNSSDPERTANRKVFYIDRKTYQILKKETVPRR